MSDINYTDAQLIKEFSRYLDAKIWIEIKPLDSWNSWKCQIYGEDCMGPFYLINALDDEFQTYASALNHAIKYLKSEGL